MTKRTVLRPDPDLEGSVGYAAIDPKGLSRIKLSTDEGRVAVAEDGYPNNRWTPEESRSMERNLFSFFHQLRVRYAEVDSQGIVFNAHYLTYFDTALGEYLKHLEYDYRGLVKDRGLDFHVVKATVEYLAPVGYDALLEIGVVAGRIGNSSLTWTLGVFSAGTPAPLAKGEIVWVCSEVGAHKAHPLPVDLVQLLKANTNV